MLKLRKYSPPPPYLQLLPCSLQLLFFAHRPHRVLTIAETEHVSLSHSQLAQGMRDEAKKLEEFREKQKEARKKVGALIGVGMRPRHLSRLLTSGNVVISDGATYGVLPQTEVFTFQEDNGCEY